MPGANYKSISINDELIERTRQLIKKLGTYHSLSEFISEAVRLRIETLEKQPEAKGETNHDLVR
ncbi:MAG: ribbon-helix-helix domain-containing protein [Candidatus Bathyarchaeia archaeon]|jgi:Arc/MetJ-type ribon-helix-helix transcriptional regulator